MKTAQNASNRFVASHAYHARAVHGFNAQHDACDAQRYTRAPGSIDVDSFDTMHDALDHFCVTVHWDHEPF
jgi:hypothetical protein